MEADMPLPEESKRMSLNKEERKSIKLGGLDATVAMGIGTLVAHFTSFTAQEVVFIMAALFVVAKSVRKFFTKKGERLS